jgi:hypothetical protein
MRRIIVLALAAAVASASGARADKTASAFIDPATVHGGTNGFSNANSTNLAAKTYSVGAAKQSGCKMKIQFKGLSGFVGGEKMICLAGADACIAANPIPCGGGFGNTIVLHVPYSSLSLKAATKADFADVDCGVATDATATNATVSCYKFDGGYDPAALCPGGGGLWIPNDTFVPGGEATDGLVGLCQYFTPSTRLPAPGSALVARDGVSTPKK